LLRLEKAGIEIKQINVPNNNTGIGNNRGKNTLTDYNAHG